MPLSNTELAAALENHINTTETYITETIAWSVDEVDTITFTDPQTQNPIEVPTLWKITSDYAALTGAEWATTPEDVLVPSGNLVDEYSCYHWFKKVEATAAGVSSISADVALVLQYKNDAETAETNAAASAAAASSSATSAGNSATAAASSAADADGDATAANASANMAMDWANEAVNVEVTTGKYSALHFATKASLWAEEDEDVEVQTGLYSAKHWAAKSEYWAGQSAASTLDSLTDVNVTGRLDDWIIYWDDTAGEYKFRDFAHSHIIADVTGLQTALDGKSDDGHTHTIANVTGLQTALDGKAPTSHSHGISDVTGLQTELDGKSDDGHGHAIGDVSGLQAALDGKAPTSHTHIIGEITGLQTELDGKSDDGHGHIIADVTGLQTALDGKSATSHSHALNELTDVLNSSPANRHVPVYNNGNSRYENRLLVEDDISDLQSYSLTGHGHVIADVTGLQTALNGKASTTHNHDSTYVKIDSPAFTNPVVLQLDVRSARSTGTETVSIAADSKVYLPVSGNNVTINLVCPSSHIVNGVTNVFLTGSILVKATTNITGLSVTTDATDDDIDNTDAPTSSGDYRVFKYELFKSSTMEYLKGTWV